MFEAHRLVDAVEERDSGSGATSALSRRIKAVLVLYKCKLADSLTYRSLVASMQSNPGGAAAVSLFVYENSPERTCTGEEPFVDECMHDPRNGGLAAAYNSALERARRQSIPWLLLLDQDTSLSPEFLETVLALGASCEPRAEIGAVVPKVRSGSVMVSPMRVRFGRQSRLPENFSGVGAGELTAINSGALLRVSALDAVGGFNPEFWLDFLDNCTFHALHRAGYRVFVSNCTLEHQLSVTDYNRYMTEARYRNLLDAEERFVRRYRSRAENLLHTARLAARHLRQRRRVRNPAIARMTLDLLLKRLKRPFGGQEKATCTRRSQAS